MKDNKAFLVLGVLGLGAVYLMSQDKNKQQVQQPHIVPGYVPQYVPQQPSFIDRANTTVQTAAKAVDTGVSLFNTISSLFKSVPYTPPPMPPIVKVEPTFQRF